MASKGLAGGIPERRVRPILDAIDSRQFKSALKHSSTLLSKYPNSPYALALRALILERMGKLDDALSICIKAKDILCKDESVNMDDLTLNTLQIVFHRLDHLDLATSCYEYACAKFPNNMDLMMGLFNCYVREYSFVKQQQTAIKMYKFSGKESFLLWAVCSIQLQVLCGNGGEKLLLFAEGLLKRHISEQGLNEPEALMVYLSILEQQSKYTEALEIISGKLGYLLSINADKLRIKGKLLACLGDYVAAAEVYQQVLIQCPDDWECFLHYLGCLFEDKSSWCKERIGDFVYEPNGFSCKLVPLADDVFYTRMSNAQDFVYKLQADARNESLRFPYLALLEICRRKRLHRTTSDVDISEFLMNYFLKFGHLGCYFSDIEVSIQILTVNEKMEFLEKLKNSCESLLAEPSKMLGRWVTFYRVQESIARTEHFSMPELSTSAVQMVELYFNNLKLSKDLEPQENVLGEDLLGMVCNVLIEQFIKTRQLGFFVEAIMVLEFGLTMRRHVWQYKILVLHLYTYIGALASAYDWYKSMDVKNILMETLLHNILSQMLLSPLWNDLNSLLKDYLRFMDDHLKESADLTYLAFRHKTYSKAIEFVLFKDKLQHSNQYLTAKIESSILLLKQKADDIGDAEGVLESIDCGIHLVKLSNDIQLKNLTFNEDLSTRPWWTPSPEKNYLTGPVEDSNGTIVNLRMEMEENARKVIKRKSILPRMIYLSIENSAACFKELELNGHVCDAEESSEIKLLLEEYARLLGCSLVDATNILLKVSYGSRSSEVFGSDMVDWLNFAVFLNAWNMNSREVSDLVADPGRSLWIVVNTLLVNCLSEMRSSVKSFGSFSSGDFSVLTRLLTEPLSWHGLVIQSCVRSCQPAGKKKKKGGSLEHSPILTAEDIRVGILSLHATVEHVTDWIKELLSVPEEQNVDILLSSMRTLEQTESPGHVLRTLERSVCTIDTQEVGDRIQESCKAWNAADIARKIISGRSKVLVELLRICESKMKSLQSWQQLVGQM